MARGVPIRHRPTPTRTTPNTGPPHDNHTPRTPTPRTRPTHPHRTHRPPPRTRTVRPDTYPWAGVRGHHEPNPTQHKTPRHRNPTTPNPTTPAPRHRARRHRTHGTGPGLRNPALPNLAPTGPGGTGPPAGAPAEPGIGPQARSNTANRQECSTRERGGSGCTTPSTTTSAFPPRTPAWSRSAPRALPGHGVLPAPAGLDQPTPFACPGRGPPALPHPRPAPASRPALTPACGVPRGGRRP